MKFLLEMLVQLLVISASLSFTGGLILYPLSPAAKRLGYTFLVPLIVIGFVRLLNDTLSSENLILIASLFYACASVITHPAQTFF